MKMQFVPSWATRLGPLQLLLFSTLSMGASGCSSATQADAEETQDQATDSTEVGETLARIELEDGRSVRFFAPEPGFVFFSERGPIGTEVLTSGEGEDVIDLYERLSGHTAPAALQAAVALGMSAPSADELNAAEEAASPETITPETARREKSADGVGVATAAISNGLTPEQFQQALCPPHFEREFFNWINVTNTGSLLRSDVHNFRSATLSQQGRVKFTAKYRTWYTWKDMAIVNLDAGWYQKVERAWEPGAYDFDARATTNEAEGDLYSMCTHF